MPESLNFFIERWSGEATKQPSSVKYQGARKPPHSRISSKTAKPAPTARASRTSRRSLGVGVAAASVWWGVLRHGLVDLFPALGSGFGALLALLVQLVLRTEELDEGLFGSVAFLEAGADDAEIAAGAVSVARGYGVKQAGDGFPGLQIGEGQAAGMQVASLAQGDQLFDVRTRSLGLGDRRLHPVLEKNGRDQVAQQGAAVAGVAS